MSRIKIALLWAVAASACGTEPAQPKLETAPVSERQALSVSLTPTKDAWFHNGDAAPFPPSATSTDGASVDLLVGRDGGVYNYIRRAVLRFDVSGIPDSSRATIDSAQLTLRVKLAGTTSSNFRLHRLTQDFAEGSVGSGTTLRPNGASCTSGVSWYWRNCASSLTWSTAGGRYSGTNSGTITVGTDYPADVTWTGGSSSQLVTDIENWRSGAWSNYGWLLRTTAEGTNYSARVFDSRSGANPPRLVVDYTCLTGRSGSACDDTNGCATNPCNDDGDNDATCVDVVAPGTGNTCWYQGSSGCGPGYQLVTIGDVQTCEEIDLCVANDNPCDASTSGRSTDGTASCNDDAPPSSGYSCSCGTGFFDNGAKCVEYDLCQDNSNPCNDAVAGRDTNSAATCTDLGPSSGQDYECNCATGWFDNGTVCLEYDPCEDNNNPCNDGPDSGATCIDANPPAQDGPTGYSCACSAGYIDNGTLCVLFDACAANNNPCDDGDDADATCIDEAPPSSGYTCSCSPGFELDHTGHCIEVNPCTSGNPCDDNGDTLSVCVDDDGASTGSEGSTCQCSNGYELARTNPGGGDAIDTCVNIDGCSGDPCAFEGDSNSSCVDLAPAPGVLADGFRCTACGPGYTVGTRNRGGDTVEVCTDFDACSAGHACDNNGDTGAACHDESPPSVTYRCSCGADYTEDGYPNATCLQLDGCTGDPCDDGGDTAAVCTDGAGTSNTCACSAGYIVSFTGPGNETCVDEDRCAALNNPCDDGVDANATCIDNSPDAATEFTCACSAGYELGGSGLCTETDPCEASNPCDDNGDTSATCEDSDPPRFGHTCTCSNGYEPFTVTSFSADDAITTCLNIDGCADDPCALEGDTDSVCVDVAPGPGAEPDGFACTACGSGYVLGTRLDGVKSVQVCRDFDACIDGNNPCDDGLPGDLLRDPDVGAACNDDAPPSSGYSCTCTGGFLPDGTTCVEIDPCLSNDNPCDDGDDAAATCIDDDPESVGYRCACSDGYVDNGTLCVNYDACSDLDNPCDDGADPSAGCTDDPPELGNGYTCECSAGFTTDADGECVEIDACSSAPCVVLGDTDATCIDDDPPSDGSSCACTNGYELVEVFDAPEVPIGVNDPVFTCVEIDGCVGDPCAGLGDVGSSCRDLPPGPAGTVPADGYECISCSEGYVLDTMDVDGELAPVCREFDACAAGNPCDDGDDPSGSCIDDPPPGVGYRCGCATGYADNGTTCVDFDACAEQPCALNGDDDAGCADLPAPSLGNDCECTSGYISAGSEKQTCLNVDGCTATDDPCDDAGDSFGLCIDAAPPQEGNLCRCSAGWQGVGESVQICEPIDGCVGNPCDNLGDASATCIDQEAPSSGNDCLCSDGFVAVGALPTVCANKNVCLSNPCASDGDADAFCEPNVAAQTYTCTCSAGFELGSSGGEERCVDIDECVAGVDDCISGAVCLNNAGSFDCVCPDGLGAGVEGCEPICGDGLVAITFEECDEGPSNSDTAVDRCRTDCRKAHCGDGVLDTGESCDDGVQNGAMRCRTDCSLPTCGDGVTNGSEECDEGVENSDTLPDGCRTACVAAFCGDGVLDTGELCDNGDSNSNSAPNACRTDCLPAFCGDGTVDEGEICDEGVDNSDVRADRCRSDCSPSRCGDGVQDSGESCDLGLDGSDTCTPDCRLTARLTSADENGEFTAVGVGCSAAPTAGLGLLVAVLGLLAQRRRRLRVRDQL